MRKEMELLKVKDEENELNISYLNNLSKKESKMMEAEKLRIQEI